MHVNKISDWNYKRDTLQVNFYLNLSIRYVYTIVKCAATYPVTIKRKFSLYLINTGLSTHMHYAVVIHIKGSLPTDMPKLHITYRKLHLVTILLIMLSYTLKEAYTHMISNHMSFIK